jgi:hypothetical protein
MKLNNSADILDDSDRVKKEKPCIKSIKHISKLTVHRLNTVEQSKCEHAIEKILCRLICGDGSKNKISMILLYVFVYTSLFLCLLFY